MELWKRTGHGMQQADIQQMLAGFEEDWFKMSTEFWEDVAKELNEKLGSFEMEMATLQKDKKFTRQVVIPDLEQVQGDLKDSIMQRQREIPALRSEI